MSADDSSDRTELAAILRRLESAENAGDAETIVDYIADDAVIMVPDQPVMEGKTVCAEFLRGMLGWMIESLDRHITYVSAEVRVIGDCAFDRGTFSFTATPKAGGATTHAHGKYLWLYSRDPAGSWKVARSIMSLDEEHAEALVSSSAVP